MSIRSIAQLKSWFQKGLYPTQSAFWDLLESFRHREEKIPISDVDTLRDELNDKFNRAEADQIIEMVENVSASFGEINNRIDGTDESIEALYTEADLLREEQVAGDAATLLAANEGILAGDAATLTAAKAYSDQKPHVTDAEKTGWNAKETPSGAQAKADTALATAKAYTDTREAVTLTAADTKDAAALASAKAYTDAAVTGIAAGIPIVNISNFETFNPSSSLVNSTTGETITLADGESCRFKADYNANGKPWMGSGTLGATNNALSSIYYWSGTITRLYGSYYMVTAYGANTTTGRPQMATRLYYSTSRYDWIVNTDYSSRYTNGYTKLPSGIMIQWGVYTPPASGSMITTFPLTFTSVYSAVTNQGIETASGTSSSAGIMSLSISNMETGSRTGGGNAYSNTVRWVAIGTWK